MEITVKIDDAEVMANIKKLGNKMTAAFEYGLTTTVAEIANDAIKTSKRVTGNNARSIAYGVGKTKKREGTPAAGRSFSPLEPTPKPFTGEIYSTSGYGGFLETGTSKMSAQPYFKPALDRNLPNLGKNIKEKL